MQTWSWNTSELIGSIGSDTNSVVWTPDVAHSILNTTTNELHGGLILRASVDYPQDDRNENDVKEQAVPVAIQSDSMDGIAGTSLGFIPGRLSGQRWRCRGAGSWTTAGTDENNSDVGSKHWRHSQPGRTTRPALTTGSSAVSSRPRRTVDQALRSTVNSPTCTRFTRAATPSTRTISFQRSSMSVRGVRPTTVTPSPSRCAPTRPIQRPHAVAPLEPEQGRTGQRLRRLDQPLVGPSGGLGTDSNLSNPDIFLGGNTWYYGLLFYSDSSGASEGMHVDDFIQFGISKVDEFTLDVNCNNPESGFASPPNGAGPEV